LPEIYIDSDTELYEGENVSEKVCEFPKRGAKNGITVFHEDFQTLQGEIILYIWSKMKKW
jgi:hypothetical protein